MLRRRRTVIVGLMTTACVHANGIDIHYVEAGEGEPLLLLDNAMVSTNPAWAAIPFAYASFLGTLAEHFRVIAPDTRGSGKSVHPGGPIPAALLADDVAALIEALNLDRPLICGFSDGGETATLVGMLPDSVRDIFVGLAANIPGLLLEDKKCALALHYRLAPEARAVLATAMEKHARLFEAEKVQILQGKAVIEARRQGVSRALVAAVAAWGEARELTEFASDAELDNVASHALHAALGFAETERVVCFRRLLAPAR